MRQIEREGGRPLRMSVWCLSLERPERDWEGMSREEQERHLEPFVMEGERFHYSNEGELFIVPEATGGRERSLVAGQPLEELKLEKAQRGMFADAVSKMERKAFQDGFVTAMQEQLPLYVELETKVLSRALKPNATVQEQRLAMQAWKDMKDRLMGKPVAPVEDVTQRPSDISAFLASAPPAVLPLSASWTPESVAEEQRQALEAGTLVVQDDEVVG